VGPGHEQQVINALDSLEAQTFRKWEAIVVDDTDTTGWFRSGDDSLKAYPYIEYIPLTQYKNKLEPLGAGYARNRGVEIARAPFILFLDADDTLHPDAIQKMLEYWNEHKAGIYPDYVGEAFIDSELANRLNKERRLLSYNPHDGEALIAYNTSEFDCRRALNQPESLNNPYIWNLITTLIPKQWHNEIGGFDEQMETWEDWDYWLRMAKAGHCFKRLPEQLVRYRFYTGGRRDLAAPDTQHGRQLAQKMIEYIKNKHSSIEVRDVGCGCGKSKNGRGERVVVSSTQSVNMSDSDFIRARYTGHGGNHHIVGVFEFSHDPGLPSRKKGPSKWVLYYGYKSRGYETLVHKEDVRLMVGRWQVLPEIEIPKVEREPALEPELIAKVVQGKSKVTPLNIAKSFGKVHEQPESKSFLQASQEPGGILRDWDEINFDLRALPGVTPAIANRLEQAELDTPDKIKEAGLEGLQQIKGIAEARARAILRALEG
jgi:glycosyltransferase involved in cell wall biosynthesis